VKSEKPKPHSSLTANECFGSAHSAQWSMKKDAVILIADDNPRHIEAMASSLYKTGAKVVATDSVRGALELNKNVLTWSFPIYSPAKILMGLNCWRWCAETFRRRR
jgi:hypothetical protein